MNKFEKPDGEESGKIKELMRDKQKATGSDGRVDFLYKQKADPEDYLLGKRVDKQFERQNFAEKSESTVGAIFDEDAIKHNLQKESQIKQRDDPLFAIRKTEENKRRELLNNPVKIKQLERALEMKKKSKKRSSGDELLAQYMAIKGKKVEVKAKKNKKEKRKLPDDERSLLQRYLELIGKAKRYVFYIDSSSSEDEDECTHEGSDQRSGPRPKDPPGYGRSHERKEISIDSGQDKSRSPHHRPYINQNSETAQRRENNDFHSRVNKAQSPDYKNKERSRENNKYLRSPNRGYQREDKLLNKSQNDRDHGYTRSSRVEDEERSRTNRVNRRYSRSRSKDRDRRYDERRTRRTESDDKHGMSASRNKSRRSDSEDRVRKPLARKRSATPDRKKSSRNTSELKASAHNQPTSHLKDVKKQKKREVSDSNSESESSSQRSNSGRNSSSESASTSGSESTSSDSGSSPVRKQESKPKLSYGLVHPKGKDVLDAKANMDVKRQERRKGETQRPSEEVLQEKPHQQPRKRLTSEEKAARLAEMTENASWREEQRKTNVERYKKEEKEEEKRTDRKRRSSGEFMKPLMKKHIEESSVEEQVRRNRHKIQRNKNPGSESNFVSR